MAHFIDAEISLADITFQTRALNLIAKIRIDC